MTSTLSPSSPQGSSSAPTSRARFFWAPLLAGGLTAAGLAGALAARIGRSGPRDLEERLARLEDRLEAGAPSARRPVFVVEPSGQGERATMAEALATLSREVAELRAPREGRPAAADPLALALSADAGQRRQAARRLRDRAKDDPAARAALSQLLADADPGVRREALDALRAIGDSQALTEVPTLLKDREAQLRERAANALAQMARRSSDPADKAKAASALEGAFSDSDVEVRKEAAGALRRLGAKEGLPALGRAVADPNFEVQEPAIEAMGEIGDRSALPALARAYGDGSGPNALEAAVAMAKLGDPTAFQKEAERLRAVLNQGGSVEEKQEALRLLAEHSPGERNALLDTALRDPSEAVRREAQRLRERSSR